MLLRYRIIVFISVLYFVPSQICSDELRFVENINKGWQFQRGNIEDAHSVEFDDSKWENINLPHTWNIDDHFDHRGVDDGLDITLSYYRGPAWYRKEIIIPKDSRRIFLFFEGANKVTKVYLNGQEVGKHIGGYTNFEFDITDYIKYGQSNLIAVWVDNSYHYDIPPQSADYTMYGGIYRDVYLIEKNPVYIDYILIKTPQVSKERALIHIQMIGQNKSAAAFKGIVKATLKSPNGKKLLKANRHLRLNAHSSDTITLTFDALETPDLWSPDRPNLYRVECVLQKGFKKLDQLSDSFGLRWFKFDQDKGFFLNGEYLRLRGVNRHQDQAGYGNAVPNNLHIRDMQLIKSMGANFVRLAHYPQDPAVLDACDSLGLLVWEEVPNVRSIGKKQYIENAKAMFKEMVIQHYNHPSIIIWGVMNEIMRDQRDSELHWSMKLGQELVAIAKELDPQRYTAQAQYKDRGTNILNITDIIGLNTYYGWYSKSFDYFGTFIDENKKKYPDKIFVISEYGAGSKRGYHKENPTPSDFSETWQLDLHQSYWQQIRQRPYIAGSCVWNMFDFASWEKGGNIPHINQKGIMTFDRKPKDIFYFYKSQWTEEPVLYIISHTWRKRKGEENELKPVEVLSNCDTVELFINDQSQGEKSSEPFIWSVRFEEGINYLKAIGTKQGMEVFDKMSVSYFVN